MNHLKYINNLCKHYLLLERIIKNLASAGFNPILVGGSVRDYLLGFEVEKIRDHDIEVYGCSLEQLQRILEQFGVVRLVGKSFGVLMLDGLSIDWSIPRSDNAGRKPVVFFDSQLSYEQAFARRDLTINAMGIDCVTGELIDPYNGLLDLKNKIARSPNLELFSQDPLRFFRLVHFISRFELSVETELELYCKQIDVSGISHTRIGQEVKKLLLLSQSPSKGLRWLVAIDRLSDLSPELAELALVPQGVKWHPEGDVLEHSLQVLDAMAKITVSYPEQKQLMLLFAALFHDVGKKEMTQILPNRISSHGHAQKGAQKIVPILKQFDVSQSMIDAVKSLVFYHMHPGQFIRTSAHIKAYKWLAYELDRSASLTDLSDLFLADLQGRNPEKTVPLSQSMDEVEQFRTIILNAGIAHEPEKPLVKAADLISHAQGKKLGDLLSRAYELQINQSISDASELKKLIFKTLLKK